MIDQGPMAKDLEIQQDLPYQYRHWRRERVGWVGIACILVAGLLGLFGHHPFSRAIAHSDSRDLIITYDRYGRVESNAEIAVTLTPEKKPGEGTIRIWFNAPYLDAVRVLSVSPLPLRGEAREGGRDVVIQTDGRPLTVLFSIQFHEFGMIQGQVKVDDGEPMAITHYVWP